MFYMHFKAIQRILKRNGHVRVQVHASPLEYRMFVNP